MRTTTILALALTAAVPALSVPLHIRPTIGVAVPTGGSYTLPQGFALREEPVAWASRELAGGYARQEQPKEDSLQSLEWIKDHSDKTQVGFRDVELNSELARRGKAGAAISKIGHAIDKIVKVGRDEELDSELARRGKAGAAISKIGHAIDKIVKVGRDEELDSELARRGKAGAAISKIGHAIDKIVKVGRDMEIVNEYVRRELQEEGSGAAVSPVSSVGQVIKKIVKVFGPKGRDLEIVNEYVRRELQEEGSGASFMLGELAARQVGSGAWSLDQARHFIMPVLGNLL